MSNTMPNPRPGHPSSEQTFLPIATGLVLRKVREEKELTQAELAIRTDMNLSYISNVENGQSNISIVKLDIICKGLDIQPGNVLNLAQSLKLDVVAEGVETAAQRDILTGLGCRYFQGFLFARPMPQDKAERYLLSGLFQAQRTPGR